jgi:glutamate-ammonia-ligase adenylyltransferase
LALTRARAVAGSPALCSEVEAAIRASLIARADDAKLIADARDMREKLASQFPGKSRWDLKYAPGGLVDIEFAAQTLQLRAAHAHPGVLTPNIIDALRNLRDAGVLTERDADVFIGAAEFQQALMQVLRIAVDGTLDPENVTPGLKALLTRACGVESFAELEARLIVLQKDVRTSFDALLGTR